MNKLTIVFDNGHKYSRECVDATLNLNEYGQLLGINFTLTAEQMKLPDSLLFYAVQKVAFITLEEIKDNENSEGDTTTPIHMELARKYGDNRDFGQESPFLPKRSC